VRYTSPFALPAPCAPHRSSNTSPNREADRFRGFDIDDQLELARLHHRQLRWPRALEDRADFRHPAFRLAYSDCQGGSTGPLEQAGLYGATRSGPAYLAAAYFPVPEPPTRATSMVAPGTAAGLLARADRHRRGHLRTVPGRCSLVGDTGAIGVA
jgi:hypothetical protein